MNNLVTIPKVVVSNKTLASVQFNEKEIVSAIELAIHNVENEIVTLESIPFIKTQMKSMNDLKEQLKRTRIDTVKDVLVNIKPFENRLIELFDKVDDARTRLDKQVKWFAMVEQAYKYEMALQIIEQTKHEIELKEKYLEDVVIEDSYLKADSNPTKVKKLIVAKFKELEQLQTMEQMKIDTIHMIIDAHNERLKFKFEFEYFERHINDETSVKELSEIVNAAVTKRLEEQKAELERIRIEQEKAVEAERLRVKKLAEEEAEKVRLAAEAKQQAEVDRIELENKKAIAKIELDRRLEQDRRDREAQDILDAEIEKNRLEQLKKDEEAAALLAEVVKETEKYIPVKNDKTVSRVQTVKLEIKGTKEQLAALKIYMADYEITYTKL